MTEWFTHEDFAGRIGDSFDLALPDGDSLVLTLQEATTSGLAGGSGPDGRSRQQFALVFAGPATPVLAQQVRRLTHAELGVFETFLVPIGPRDDAMRYEAVYA